MPLNAATRILVLALATLPVAGCDALQQDAPEPVELSFDGLDVLATQTGDLLVQSGEAVRADVFLTNRTSAVDSVRFTITGDGLDIYGDDTHVFVAGQDVTNRRDAALGAGETARISIIFRVRPNTPVGTVGSLAFALTSPSGRIGRAATDVTTVALPYAPAVRSTRIIADTDGDGQAEPGETVTAEVELATGSQQNGLCYPDDNTFRASVTSSSSQVTLIGSSSAYLCPTEVSDTTRFQFRTASSMPAGSAVPLDLNLRDDYGNTWALPFQITLR